MEVDGFVMEPVMLCTDGPFFLFAVTSIFYPTVCGLVSPSTSYTISTNNFARGMVCGLQVRF
jgi:hypothetical protein